MIEAGILIGVVMVKNKRYIMPFEKGNTLSTGRPGESLNKTVDIQKLYLK